MGTKDPGSVGTLVKNLEELAPVSQQISGNVQIWKMTSFYFYFFIFLGDEKLPWTKFQSLKCVICVDMAWCSG